MTIPHQNTTDDQYLDVFKDNKLISLLGAFKDIFYKENDKHFLIVNGKRIIKRYTFEYKKSSNLRFFHSKFRGFLLVVILNFLVPR